MVNGNTKDIDNGGGTQREERGKRVLRVFFFCCIDVCCPFASKVMVENYNKVTTKDWVAHILFLCSTQIEASLFFFFFPFLFFSNQNPT